MPDEDLITVIKDKLPPNNQMSLCTLRSEEINQRSQQRAYVLNRYAVS